MGSSYIKLSREGLTQSMKRVKQAKEDYDNALKSLEMVINSLQEVWEGDAQRRMEEKFQESRKTFQQFGEEIESYANGMNNVLRTLPDLDEKLSSIINSSIN